MHFYVDSNQGHLFIGDYGINWANADPEYGLPGFFAINLGRLSVELGEIDQESPGIYITTYSGGEVDSRKTIWASK